MTVVTVVTEETVVTLMTVATVATIVTVVTVVTKQLCTSNIARIEKRCPENITSFVKCVKLLFSKVLRKYFLQ